MASGDDPVSEIRSEVAYGVLVIALTMVVGKNQKRC